MRSDRLYLADIADALSAIRRFMGSLTLQAFVADELVQSAVLQKLTVIGEASARISESTRALAPEVPWKEIVGFRNIIVHAYFSVDWQMVFISVQDDLPPLSIAVDRLMRTAEERADSVEDAGDQEEVARPGSASPT